MPSGLPHLQGLHRTLWETHSAPHLLLTAGPRQTCPRAAPGPALDSCLEVRTGPPWSFQGSAGGALREELVSPLQRKDVREAVVVPEAQTPPAPEAFIDAPQSKRGVGHCGPSATQPHTKTNANPLPSVRRVMAAPPAMPWVQLWAQGRAACWPCSPASCRSHSGGVWIPAAAGSHAMTSLWSPGHPFKVEPSPCEPLGCEVGCRSCNDCTWSFLALSCDTAITECLLFSL